ncbi:MAG: Flagellum-specific ATP synthase FliI [Firmicutes bacterium]|nr:Flagellum-specific ATP synthase FliI [Bacillota bacterium]MDI6704668.1 flagellar protein export ATPase FliI [Bacillota bacterium]
MNRPDLDKYSALLKQIDTIKYSGRVSKVIGLTIEAIGPSVNIGEITEIVSAKDKRTIKAEVVGFRDNRVLMMPLGDMEGIGPGSTVIATGDTLRVAVGDGLLGRVIDGLGNPIDGKGSISFNALYPLSNSPPNPLDRKRITEALPLGIKSIDGLLTCGKGQRIGIFSGSGVGKSTLLGMIARNTSADVNVIGLIGERGREVREFLENDLGEEGLERSVVVVATSDQPALVRLKSALLVTTIAEFFRDKGKDVMLMMDSLTRFALAQREVGLAIGEPPVTRGFTPSVFAILPKLLERTGTSSKGSITSLYAVLVDGDDMNEPIADAVRGILDGHIVLSRALANKNHFPAVDVLMSISRLMPNVVSQEHLDCARRLKDIIAVYRNAEDLISIGAYSKGSKPEVDYSISKMDEINAFLKQGIYEKSSFDVTTDELLKLLD